MGIGSEVGYCFPGNQFRRGYQYSRNRFRHGYHFPGNWFHCEYRFPGNQFQRGCRYSKEIVFNVNTDIPRKSAPTWIPFPRNSVLVWIPIFQAKKSVLEWIPIFQVFFGFSLNRFSGSLCLLGQ
ncbi:hypothetical protein RIR_jg28904.t1 [Rhizophagus irregularis DAOM 181602=DAOM 197198]|nr:hypothetical protein RIR_jg28904.t1 [Rhizophagus irregularis DAOM 181602=DAOM 197198]